MAAGCNGNPVNYQEMEIREKIYKSLKGNGLPEWLKTQFRSKLAKELQENGTRESPSLVLRRSTLPCVVANGLVLDHLHAYKFDFSHSLFMSESGTKEVLPKDLLDYLHIPVDSPLYKKLVEKKHGILTSLLKELSRHFTPPTTTSSTGVQTEADYATSLPIAQKLTHIEMEFSSRHSNDVASVDERLAFYQNQCDQRAKQQVKLEVQRIREVELAQVKLAEQERYQKQLTRIQDQLHTEYRQKLDGLNKLERSLHDKMRQREEELENSVHLQRQVLLKELDVVKMRESELRRQSDLCRQSVKCEEERVKALLEEVERREAGISEVKRNCSKQVDAMKMELQLEAERRERVNDSTIGRMQIKIDELHEAVKKLENDKLQLKSELEHSKSECYQLRASLHSATSEQVELQKQKDLLQQQVNSSEVQSRSHHVRQLEREVESLQRKLEGVIDDADHRENEMKATIDELTKRATEKEAEMVKLQDEVHKEVARRRGDVKKLQTEKDHFQKAVALLKDRIDSLHLLVSEKDILLTDAIAEAEDLRGQVAVLEKAVSGYLKRGSSRSSPVPLPSAFRGRQESRDPLKSKKILRFADPVISHPPLKEATGRFEKPLTTSSQWSSVTEDHFAETQAIYERLRQVSKELEQSYSRMTDSDITQSEGSLLSSASPLATDSDYMLDASSQDPTIITPHTLLESSHPVGVLSSHLPEITPHSVTVTSYHSLPPNVLPPSSLPPSSLPLPTLPPSSLPPSLLPPSTLPPSSLPPSTLPPSSLPPSTLPPSSLPPSSLPPSLLPPSSLPPVQSGSQFSAQSTSTHSVQSSHPSDVSSRVLTSHSMVISQPTTYQAPQSFGTLSQPIVQSYGSIFSTTPHPVGTPTSHPVGVPTSHPVGAPTSHPVGAPTPHPVGVSMSYPFGTPTSHPIGMPTPHPVGVPTPHPIGTPTPHPVGVPTPHPIGTPTPQPVGVPTPQPVGTSLPLMPVHMTTTAVANTVTEQLQVTTSDSTPSSPSTISASPSTISASPSTTSVSTVDTVPPPHTPSDCIEEPPPAGSPEIDVQPNGHLSDVLEKPVEHQSHALPQHHTPQATTSTLPPRDVVTFEGRNISLDSLWQGEDQSPTAPLTQHTSNKMAPISETTSDDEWEQQRKEKLKEREKRRREEQELLLKQCQVDDRPVSENNGHANGSLDGVSSGVEQEGTFAGEVTTKGWTTKVATTKEAVTVTPDEDHVDPVLKKYMEIVMKEKAAKQEQHQPSKQNGKVDEFGIPLPSNDSYSFGEGSVDSPFEDW